MIEIKYLPRTISVEIYNDAPQEAIDELLGNYLHGIEFEVPKELKDIVNIPYTVYRVLVPEGEEEDRVSEFILKDIVHWAERMEVPKNILAREY